MVLIQLSYNNQLYELDIDTSESVELLQCQIQSLTNLDTADQRLIYNNQLINENTNLEQINIKPGSIITLINTKAAPAADTATATVPTAAPSALSVDALAAALRSLPIFQQQQQQQQPIHSRSTAATAASSPPISLDLQSTCTRSYFNNDSIVQPSAIINGSRVCIGCSMNCHLPSDSQPPQSIQPFTCECIQIATAAGRECLFTILANNPNNINRLYSDIAITAKSQLAQFASQQFAQYSTAAQQQMLARLRSHSMSVLDYENPKSQSAALAVIPIDRLTIEANEALATAAADADTNTNTTAPRLGFRDYLLKRLLHWFKHEFFKWVNAPVCQYCQSATTGIGGTQPNSAETPFKPGVVELYKCNSCTQITRFPRYNDAAKLLETRCGRCGEWANCFTLICRAMGFEARAVIDWTDHVWTEIYSEHQQKWHHCDPCENAYDSPLMYEAGWGKKLTYCIAFSVDELVDTTKRYSHKWNEVLERRLSSGITEEWLNTVITQLNQQKFESLSVARQQELLRRRLIEQKEFNRNTLSAADREQELKAEELIGRQTGSVEWRRARGELGNQPVINSTATAAAASITTEIAKNTTSPTECKTTIKPTTAVLSSSSTASCTVPLPISEASKDRAKALFIDYYKQLTVGCGNRDCTNEYCKSSSNYQYKNSNNNSTNTSTTLTTTAIARLSIELIKQYHSTLLCHNLTTSGSTG